MTKRHESREDAARRALKEMKVSINFEDTPLAEVIPLKRFGMPHVAVISPAPPAGEDPGPATSGRFPLALSVAGRHEEAVQIGSTDDGSADLWEGLPNLHWVREDTTMARAARPLAPSFWRPHHQGERST